MKSDTVAGELLYDQLLKITLQILFFEVNELSFLRR